MEVKFINHFENDKLHKNYDYSKFSVHKDNGSFLTNIFKHDGVYYNLFDNTPYIKLDDCLNSISKRFLKKSYKPKKLKK